MSASTERKTRQAAREAGTDKKTLAREKAAQEQAKSNRRWRIGTIAVIVLIVLVLLLSSPLMYRLTAYTVGSRNFSAAEVNYLYARQYMNFASYGSMFGLDTSGGLAGLGKQDCPFTDGTWRDYFLEAAKNEMAQTTALLDYAADNNITLDADELAELETGYDGLEDQARSYGYGSVNKMLSANYGGGVNLELVKRVDRDTALASKAMNALGETFTFTDEELEAQYQSYEGSRDYFDYSYVTVEAHADEGEATEESKAAAMQTAEAIKAAFDDAEGEDFAARLSEAAEAQGLTATRSRRTSGSSLVAAGEWMLDAARKAGDITVEADADGDHVYVVLFLGRDDNHYYPVSVRHILVKAEANEDGVYTDQAKAAAKAKAEAILAEYEAGDKTEERFAELAERDSEDPGSNTNGGLYESVYKGQMVEEFEAFCFADHEPGDTGIVYGDNGSYAGYHVMYFVGKDDELYSNTLAKSDLSSTALTEKLEEMSASYTTSEKYGMRLVG